MSFLIIPAVALLVAILGLHAREVVAAAEQATGAVRRNGLFFAAAAVAAVKKILTTTAAYRRPRPLWRGAPRFARPMPSVIHHARRAAVARAVATAALVAVSPLIAALAVLVTANPAAAVLAAVVPASSGADDPPKPDLMAAGGYARRQGINTVAVQKRLERLYRENGPKEGPACLFGAELSAAADGYRISVAGAYEGCGVLVEAVLDRKTLIPSVSVNGLPIRSARLIDLFSRLESSRHLTKAELTPEGVSWALRVVEAAFAALVYRQHSGEEYFLNKEGQIATREVEVRERPLCTLLGIEVVPVERKLDEMAIREAIEKLEDQGLYPVALQGNRFFCARSAKERLRVLRAVGVAEHVLRDAHTLTRLGTLLKRPGTVSLRLALEGEPLSKSFDGTLAITPDLGDLYQVTMLADKPFRAAKGVVRGTIRLGREVEEPGFSTAAYVGERVFRAGDAVVAYILALSHHESARTNLQTVAFTAADPAGLLSDAASRLAAEDLADRLGRRQRRLYNAGVPLAALLGDISPFEMARKLPVPGARAKVLASAIVRKGRVALLPGTARAIEKRLGRELVLGETLVIQRDPAMPDGRALATLKFAGVAHYTAAPGRGFGVVLAAGEPSWSLMGGDFDGDAALVWAASELPVERVEPLGIDLASLQSLKVGKVRPVAPAGVFSWRETLVETGVTLADRVGPIVTSLLQLWELGELDGFHRELGTLAAQGSLWAQKHAVDERRVKAAERAIRDELYRLVDDLAVDACTLAFWAATGVDEEVSRKRREFLAEETFTGLFGAYRRAGLDEKPAVWRKLVELARRSATAPLSEEQAALAWLVLAADEQNRRHGLLRNAQPVLPEMLRRAAAALASTADLKVAARYAARYRKVARKLAVVADGDDARRAVFEELAAVRAEVRALIRRGKLAPEAVVAKCPARVVADVVEPEVLERLGFRHREGVFRFVEPLTGETLTAELLLSRVDPRDRDGLRAFLNGAEMISVAAEEADDGVVRARLVVDRAPLARFEDDDEDDAEDLVSSRV